MTYLLQPSQTAIFSIKITYNNLLNVSRSYENLKLEAIENYYYLQRFVKILRVSGGCSLTAKVVKIRAK